MIQRFQSAAGTAELILIGTASVLPVAGSLLDVWPFTAVVLLYLLEVVTILFFYAGLAMFAAPEQQLDERERIAPPGPLPDQYFSEEPWQPVDFIPPIYPKNLRFVIPMALFGLFMAFLAGAMFTGSGGRRTEGRIGDFLAQFAVFESPSVFVAGLFIVSVHLLTLSRYYFGTGRYQELTAHMALEVVVNYYTLYFYFSFAFLLYALMMLFVMDPLPPDFWLSYGVVVAVSFLVPKLALEHSRYHGERQPELDEGFASNFSPMPPPQSRRW